MNLQKIRLHAMQLCHFYMIYEDTKIYPIPSCVLFLIVQVIFESMFFQGLLTQTHTQTQTRFLDVQIHSNRHKAK